MTTKEIVQVLRRCRLGKPCTGCPAAGRGKEVCSFDEVHAAAVAAIEHLTAETADLRKEIEWKDMVIALARREQAKAEAERDAALADLADARNCKTCKYACDTRDCSSCNSTICRCRECHLDKIAWEWRGLPGAQEDTQ